MPDRREFIAEVVSNIQLCREHFRLVLGLREFPATRPGQFVQLLCRELWERMSLEVEAGGEDGARFSVSGDELRGAVAMLRRPFSLAGRRDVGGVVEIDIIHRVVGVGTKWLSELKAGERVSVLGPLGNWFALPTAGTKAILVGGGVGIPPMLYLAEALEGPAIAFCGATTGDLLPLTIKSGGQVEEFERYGISSIISTDDGSIGFRGYVTEALEHYLDSAAERAIIYTCGPEPMMKRVAEIAMSRGIACQVAAERAMACGMGTCQSCCIKVKGSGFGVQGSGNTNWRYKLTCTDGPVFAADDLLW